LTQVKTAAKVTYTILKEVDANVSLMLRIGGNQWRERREDETFSGVAHRG
jgi:hypothetical protein